MKIRDFLKILKAHGFTEKTGRVRGSHHRYVGFVRGERRFVTVDYTRTGQDIWVENLASMIRQSGLPKKLFK